MTKPDNFAIYCVIQLSPDDGGSGQGRYEVPRSVVDVQLPAFSADSPRRYSVNIINEEKFAFQVVRQDTGTVLYARFVFYFFATKHTLRYTRSVTTPPRR